MSEDSILSHDSKLYARRNVVESQLAPEEDPDAEYVTKLVVKTHRVAKGETLSKIAKRYGVSTAEIKKWNKLKKNTIARGRKLKIHTYERVATGRKKSEVQAVAAAENADTSADSIATAAAPVDSAATVLTASAEVQSEEKGAEPAPAPQKAKTTKVKQTKKSSKGDFTYHTVKKGESLYSIAKKYKGVSISDLQKANGLGSKSNIRAGQKIKIPRS